MLNGGFSLVLFSSIARGFFWALNFGAWPCARCCFTMVSALATMSKIHEARMELRKELVAPSALSRFGSLKAIKVSSQPHQLILCHGMVLR
jgi:hypothetical protein